MLLMIRAPMERIEESDEKGAPPVGDLGAAPFSHPSEIRTSLSAGALAGNTRARGSPIITQDVLAVWREGGPPGVAAHPSADETHTAISQPHVDPRSVGGVRT